MATDREQGKLTLNARRVFFVLLSFAVAGLIFGKVASSITDWRDSFRLAVNRWWWLAAAFGCFGASLMLGTLRWITLLRTLKLPITTRRAIQLYAVGHFFSVLLPGATGGDVVKATFAAIDSPGKKTEAVASIATERLIGMVSLFVILGIIAWSRNDFFQRTPELRLAQLIAKTLAVGAVCGSAFLFGINWSKLLPSPERIRFRAFRAIVSTTLRMYNAAGICASHPLAAISALVLSFANHAVTFLQMWVIGNSVGAIVPLLDYFTVAPFINTVVTIPITPGGIGVREAMTCQLMGCLGMEAASAATIAVLYNLVVVMWALIGGALFLSLRRRP